MRRQRSLRRIVHVGRARRPLMTVVFSNPRNVLLIRVIRGSYFLFDTLRGPRLYFGFAVS